MIFAKKETVWKELNAYWTSKEIYQQPSTWHKTYEQVCAEKTEIASLIAKVVNAPDYDIVLTGAGTSEFVGNAVYSYLNTLTNYKAKSYATTDIVVCPENYLSRTKPTLLISFGRSGNSPESVAAVECANEVCDNVYHLFITCNHDGALSKFAIGKDNCYAINLTEETHDQSFAMTSSFTNMYLAAVLAFNLDRLDDLEDVIDDITNKTQLFLDERYKKIVKLVDEFNFKRIVYLGSNVNKGIAQESALKLCELTKGIIDTNYDTPMGFRHGPKSVINPETLTVVYLSDDEYTRQYEYDIIKEMSGQRNGNKIVAVGSNEDSKIEELVDLYISFDNRMKLDNIFLGLEYITVAQTLAIFKSISMSITPDNPCPSGEVNRVVQGVTIYPYKKR